MAHPKKATLTSNGWELDLTNGDMVGDVVFFGEPAGNNTPRQIAESVINQTFPGATIAYEIPNAMVGYQPGYGEIADFYPQSSTSSYSRKRILVEVAEKNGFALIAAATGPYKQFAPPPEGDTDHPSGANLEVAQVMGPFVNSFTWQGDQTRRP